MQTVTKVNFIYSNIYGLYVKFSYTCSFCGHAYCTGLCIFPNHWLFVLPHQTFSLCTIPVSEVLRVEKKIVSFIGFVLACLKHGDVVFSSEE